MSGIVVCFSCRNLRVRSDGSWCPSCMSTEDVLAYGDRWRGAGEAPAPPAPTLALPSQTPLQEFSIAVGDGVVSGPRRPALVPVT